MLEVMCALITLTFDGPLGLVEQRWIGIRRVPIRLPIVS